MKTFIVVAHTLPTYGGITRFVREVTAINKEFAIKSFVDVFGTLNFIDRIIEMKKQSDF